MKLAALIEGRLLRGAWNAGVELLAWGVQPATAELTLNRQLEIIL
jgi:hypothetical protein